MDTDKFYLKIIIFFESLGFGVMYPHICPHILDTQGTQLYVGIFTALNLLCSLLSDDVTKSFLTVKGKKFGTYMILMLSIVTHVCSVMTNYIAFIMFCRLVFTLTNETSSFCKAMLLNIVPPEEHPNEIITVSLLSSAGFVLGPIIGGIIFSLPGGFTLISLVTAAITFGNVLLLLRVNCAEQDYKAEDPPEDVFVKCKRNLEGYAEDFANCNFYDTWPFFAVQFLFTSAWTIVFLKFPQILYSNFNVGTITYGFAGAFNNLLIFLLAMFLPGIKDKYIDKYPISTRIEISFMVNIVSLMIICHSQVFVLYWFFCIPLIFTKCLLNSYWSTIYALCDNDRILNLIQVINILAGVLTPIMYGLVCTVLCPDIVKMYACFATVLAFILFVYYIKPLCT